jgi:hypothetical protein
MNRGFDITRIGGQTIMDGVYNTPWIGGSICHGKRVKIPWVGVLYTMDRGFDIPSIGGQTTMGKGFIYNGKGFDIPWVRRSKYHG